MPKRSRDPLQELAEKTGRAKSNLSRTLKTMEHYGLVQFEPGNGRKLAPRVHYTDLAFGMPFAGVMIRRHDGLVISPT